MFFIPQKIQYLITLENYVSIVKNDEIVYASGAGVQATLKTGSTLMYALNVTVPLEITLGFMKVGYGDTYVSFKSDMDIGARDDEDKAFNEGNVVFSSFSVSNDYALSKRLYGHYMWDFDTEFTYHFILPSIFSEDDLKPGICLAQYTLKNLQDYAADELVEKPKFSAGIQMHQFITFEGMIQTVDNAINTKNPSEMYCVEGGEYLSILSLIERLLAIYDVPCKNEYFGQSKRRDGDIRSLRLNGAKLYSVLGYQLDKSI